MEQPGLEWIALSPERIEGDQAPMFEEIVSAFQGFKTEKEKGHGTADWLAEHALDGWPGFISWVCWDPLTPRIDGFFTVGKTKLDQSDLGDVPFEAHLAPTSEIKNVRRNAYALLTEDELVEDAVTTAIDAWREVGASQVTVVLDPAGAQLCHEHEFWRECADKKRLWARFPLGGSGARPESFKP